MTTIIDDDEDDYNLNEMMQRIGNRTNVPIKIISNTNTNFYSLFDNAKSFRTDVTIFNKHVSQKRFMSHKIFNGIYITQLFKLL